MITLFRYYQEIGSTTSRNFAKQKRKFTSTSYYSNSKQVNESRSNLKKKNIKLTQITFKKSKFKVNRNKNSSEISAASNKNSREFILKSFISNDSKKKAMQKKRKLPLKQRGTIMIPDSLWIIKEENKMGTNKKNVTSNSWNHYLLKKMKNKEELLSIKRNKAEGIRRPTVWSIESNETNSKKKIFGDQIPTSSNKISSPTGGYIQSNERRSGRKRYNSIDSFNNSWSRSSYEDGKIKLLSL